MSYSDAFFNPIQSELLRTLYADEKRPWYQRELAAYLEIPLTTLQRELQELVRVGFLVATQRGRKMLYRLNSSCPIHNEVRSILVKTYGVVDEIAALLRPFNKSIESSFVRDTGPALHQADFPIVVHVIGTVDLDELRPKIWQLSNRLGRQIRIDYQAQWVFEQHVRLRHPVAMDIMNCRKIWLKGDAGTLTKLKTHRPRKGDRIWGPPPDDRIWPT